jgi:hypothetical protein
MIGVMSIRIGTCDDIVDADFACRLASFIFDTEMGAMLFEHQVQGLPRSGGMPDRDSNLFAIMGCPSRN